MENESAPTKYERLERKLDDVKNTLNTNHRAQQDCMNDQNTEIKDYIKKLQDQNELLQGQLSEINKSLNVFRERYHIPEPRSHTRLDAVNGQDDTNRVQGGRRFTVAHLELADDNVPAYLRPHNARIRRKSWAAGSHHSVFGSSISSGSEDERIRNMEIRTNCMASAIKRNFVSIVETLPFKESEIPDCVIETCVSVSECENIRGLKDRRDQVRTLVTMVIKREFDAMESFLKIISEHNADLCKNIEDTFNELLAETAMIKVPCTLCSLVKKVDIKDVCDHFYERDMLSDDLYREIVSNHSSEELWRKMLDSLAGQPSFIVMSIIIMALKHHGTFHTNIVRMLGRAIQRRRLLECKCPSPLMFQPPSADTASPASSADMLSFSLPCLDSIRDSSEATPTSTCSNLQVDSSTCPPFTFSETDLIQESSETPLDGQDSDKQIDRSVSVSSLPFSPHVAGTTPKWTETTHRSEDSELEHDHSDTVTVVSSPQQETQSRNITPEGSTSQDSELQKIPSENVQCNTVPSTQDSELQKILLSENVSSLPVLQHETDNPQESSEAKPNVQGSDMQQDLDHSESLSPLSISQKDSDTDQES